MGLGQQGEPAQEHGGHGHRPQQGEGRRGPLQQALVPLGLGAPEDPVEEGRGDGAEDSSEAQGENEESGKGEPLPPHEVARPVALEVLRHPVPDPPVGQRVVPSVDAGHGLAREGPVGAGGVARADDEDRVLPAAPIGHLADRVHPRGQAVLLAALRERRKRVEVDVEVALEDGAELSGQLRAARFLARRQLQIARRALEVALAGGELDEGAGRGPWRVGRFRGRLRCRGRRRGGCRRRLRAGEAGERLGPGRAREQEAWPRGAGRSGAGRGASSVAHASAIQHAAGARSRRPAPSGA